MPAYVGQGAGSDVGYVAAKTGAQTAVALAPLAAASFQATGAITMAGIGAAATAETAAGAAVSSLLTVAGIEATAGPVGWILAAGTLIAAGAIATVHALKGRSVRRDMVADFGKAYGFPQAAAFPDFVMDAMSSGPQWRRVQANKLERKIAKGRGKDWINRSKLTFLGVLEAYELAERRAAAGLPSAPPTESQVAAVMYRAQDIQEAVRLQQQTRTIALLGAAGLGLVALLLLRSG
jgi:hypothetical protein